MYPTRLTRLADQRLANWRNHADFADKWAAVGSVDGLRRLRNFAPAGGVAGFPPRKQNLNRTTGKPARPVVRRGQPSDNNLGKDRCTRVVDVFREDARFRREGNAAA